MKRLILLIALGLFLASFVGAESFTPIFCNDYEFTGCYAEESTITEQISDEDSWVCPEYADECYVESVEDNEEWYVGFGNCHLDTTLCDGWVCDVEYSRKKYMDSGDHVYLESECLNPSKPVEIKITKPILKFSGAACGAGGVAVSGADGCAFTPNGGVVYDIGMSNKKERTSYTVPLTTPSPTCVMSWVSGNRHICGYKNESCSSNNDCSSHTYGNKECTGKTLQEYGCRSYGSIPGELTEISGGLLNLDGDVAGAQENAPQTSTNTFGQRCEIINSEIVQCCGDTDCGSSMFCDIDTFTCKEEVECNSDTDCGVSGQCDWTMNILKNPRCIGGKCSYSEEAVGCCLDKNCEAGSYCDEGHQCEIGQAAQKDLSVSDGSNSSRGSSYSINDGSSSTGTTILIIFLVLIGGSTAFFFYAKRKKKPATRKKKVKEEKETPVKKQITASKYCTACGYLLGRNSIFCTMCGKKSKQ